MTCAASLRPNGNRHVFQSALFLTKNYYLILPVYFNRLACVASVGYNSDNNIIMTLSLFYLLEMVPPVTR